MKSDFHSIRREALDWWNNLSIGMQDSFIHNWKSTIETNSIPDFKKKWTIDMIKMSSSAIESIYIHFKRK